MLRSLGHMRMVHNRRRAGINGFQQASKLAPEDIFRRLVVVLQIASWVVV